MTIRGLLIAFEGGDGSGKSTQTRILADRLQAVATRQAGGTPFGERLRELTLEPSAASLSERAEAMLYMADRAEHIDKVIRPALIKGQHVVTDRYAYSTLAYQGYGRGLDVDELRQICDWAVDGIWPDMVIYLDVPADVGTERVAAVGELDHYELSGVSLQRRVTDGYRALAGREPDRWRLVDGVGSIDEVAERVWSAVQPLVERATVNP